MSQAGSSLLCMVEVVPLYLRRLCQTILPPCYRQAQRQPVPRIETQLVVVLQQDEWTQRAVEGRSLARRLRV